MKTYIPALFLLLPLSGAFYVLAKSPDVLPTSDRVFIKKNIEPVAPDVTFKSVDRGETWQQVTGTLPVDATPATEDRGITVNSINNAAYLNKLGNLLKSTDHGKTWKPVYSGYVRKIAKEDGIMMATSQKGIIRSTDDGEHWETVLSEGGVGIDVARIKGGFASITYNTESKTRRVRATYDGGKTWLPIDAGLPESQSIASITEVGEFLFCGHEAGVFRSSDRGKTWKRLLQPVDSKVFNLSVSGKVIYATAKAGGC